jgi:hypothetical protein
MENYVYEVRGPKAERKRPVQAYAITGHDIEDDLYPDDSIIDHSKQYIRVEHKSHRGQRYEWTMIPLLPLDEDIEANTMDRLLVFEEPNPSYYYSAGIDTADGLGNEDEDRTVVSITRNRHHGEYDYQCAEYTTNRLNAAQITAFAACIGAWYAVDSPDGKGMKFCIEQIGRPGDICQHQLKMMGFFNHHKPRRYDSKKIKEDAGRKEGWYSTGWSVSILMTRFVEAVNGGWYRPQSKWLIEELKTLERHVTSGKSKMEHRSGQHDDRVRAAAQSFFTAHDFDVLTDRAQKRYAVPQKKKISGGGRAGLISVGDWE